MLRITKNKQTNRKRRKKRKFHMETRIKKIKPSYLKISEHRKKMTWYWKNIKVPAETTLWGYINEFANSNI